MNLVSKKKKIEFLLVFPLALLIYFFSPDINTIVLFIFGYIWNWVNSIESGEAFSEKRYRFSLIRFVRSIQAGLLRPFQKAPFLLKKIIGIFPAGAFWFLILFIYESDMPWWAPFLGSLVFEILSFEISTFRKDIK